MVFVNSLCSFLVFLLLTQQYRSPTEGGQERKDKLAWIVENKNIYFTKSTRVNGMVEVRLSYSKSDGF